MSRRMSWPLTVDNSPITLTHKISLMKVGDELSFPKNGDFTLEIAKNYFERYVKMNPKTAFDYMEGGRYTKFIFYRTK